VRILLVVAVVAMLMHMACISSNMALVARATSTATYYQASYQHHCEGTGNPPAGCAECRKILNEALWKIEAANASYKLGYLPLKERADLVQFLSDVQKCP